MLQSSERTFGLELEFADVSKKNLEMPNGYSWSPNEKSIVNTNGTKSTPAGDFGGEVNTPPLHPVRSDIRQLRRFIKSCFKCGGVPMWNTGFDGHLYIGDFGLDELKKIFALYFVVSPFINDIFNLGEWFNVPHLVPSPSVDLLDKVRNAQSFENLKATFSNSSTVGHYRFQINIMAYFKTKTVEFRIFNGTRNFRETLETIKFMYSFVEYAIKNDVSDFEKINSRERFLETFGVNYSRLPKSIAPLLFAESHLVPKRNISVAFPVSRKLLSFLIQNTPDEIATVNPFLFFAETAMGGKKKLTIYNNSEFNHILYRISTGDLKITYKEQFEVLNSYKDGSPECEISILMIFCKAHLCDLRTDYGACEFDAYVNAIPDSIAKMKESSKALVSMLVNATYKNGTIHDALMSEKTIFFQQEKNSRNANSICALKKLSDYKSDFKYNKCSLANLDIKESQTLFIVSKNDFLPYYKVAKNMYETLYSSKKIDARARIEKKKQPWLNVKIPPDALKITPDSDVKITQIKPSVFSLIQKRFVKKVIKPQTPVYCFVVTQGEMLLGGFGFNYVKEKDSEYDLFLLCDLCTNNSVNRLSKLIILMCRTAEVKKMLERSLVTKINKAYTKVYTTMPASMKYRGVFKKVSRGSNCLVYAFEFGSIKSVKDALIEYSKKTQDGEK